MKKSVAVLGLGRFGKSLAENLDRLGADVLVADSNEALVQDFSGKCTSAVCADLEMEEDVTALGLNNMDVVVVDMSNNLAASVMVITVAKELGVPQIVAKASSKRMESILLKIGADRIFDPDGDAGLRSARILMSSSFKDFYELDGNMYMVEMAPKDEWLGKSLSELSLRSRFNLNVVAEKGKDGLWQPMSPQKHITPESVLLIVAEKKSINSLQ